MLAVSDREKLLSWDEAEESSNVLVSAGWSRWTLYKQHRRSFQGNPELTQDVVLLFISGFLPSVVSLSGPKTGTEIRMLNSTLCGAAFFPCPLMSYQVDAETRADKSQADSGQDGGASGSQSSASAPSAFQLLANAFRRTFNVTNPPGGSDSAVIMFVWITACLL